jgi:hypothetical protein
MRIRISNTEKEKGLIILVPDPFFLQCDRQIKALNSFKGARLDLDLLRCKYQCCGTGSVGTLTFCLSGTVIKWNHKR